jgi:hypothetical protein
MIFLSPCSARIQSDPHNNISTHSVDKDARYGSMTLPLALKY